jgi:4-hydroxy-2-oxoglutarate aldolase
MTDAALERHFTSVADASEIPIVLYNVPRYTHLPLSFELVSTLSRHPNVAGIKDSAGDPEQLIRLQSLADPTFQVFAGTASVWLAGLRAGVRAGIMAVANCTPGILLDIKHLHDRGRPGEAEALQTLLHPFNKSVTVTFGIPGLKAAAAMAGYESGLVRAPLLPLSDADLAEVRRLTSAVLAAPSIERDSAPPPSAPHTDPAAAR